VSKAAIAALCRTERSSLTVHDLTPVFIYYTSWVAHLTISVGVGVGAARGAFHDASSVKTTELKRFRVGAFLLVLMSVIVCDALHGNLAMLSHDRIFKVLSAEHSLA